MTLFVGSMARCIFESYVGRIESAFDCEHPHRPNITASWRGREWDRLSEKPAEANFTWKWMGKVEIVIGQMIWLDLTGHRWVTSPIFDA